MKYSKINKIHFDGVKSKIQKLKFKNIFDEFLETYNNNYELFTKSKFSLIWYETLLSQFSLALDDKKMKAENRLNFVLDLQVSLEIRSQKIQEDPSSIYRKINYDLVA